MITVGVDGSHSSESALRFASEEARLHGAKLRVVIAWEIPATIYLAPGAYDAVKADTIEQNSRETARSQIERVLGPADGRDIEVVARQGAPAAVLIDESERAQMLVVGSRGHGGFAGLLLGSVSQQCASHAHCPVVIVQPSSEEP